MSNRPCGEGYNSNHLSRDTLRSSIIYWSKLFFSGSAIDWNYWFSFPFFLFFFGFFGERYFLSKTLFSDYNNCSKFYFSSLFEKQTIGYNMSQKAYVCFIHWHILCTYTDCCRLSKIDTIGHSNFSMYLDKSDVHIGTISATDAAK